MVYVTGDLHGDYDIAKLTNGSWKDQYHMTRDDFLIITGDFGLPFFSTDVDKEGNPLDASYAKWIDFLSREPYTILFADGNHENFNFWKEQKTEQWHGGMVQRHPHADNVIHLMRGEVYDIEGKTWFVFGGAPSHGDIFNQDQYNWYPEEEASDGDILNARFHLEQCGYQVDYILTHTIPKFMIEEKLHLISESKTEAFLEEVLHTVNYKMWTAGHFHTPNMYPDEKLYILYQSFAKPEDLERRITEYNRIQAKMPKLEEILANKTGGNCYEQCLDI